MASLRQFRHSKYLYACFSMPDGKRVQRSTKLTDRREAQRLADTFEEATRAKITEHQARKVYRAICRQHDIDLGGGIVRKYAEDWTQRKKLECSIATARKYAQVAKDFVSFLETKADGELVDISHRDIIRYRDHLAGNVAPGTANNALKVVRVMFGDARREGLIESNPAEIVKTIATQGHQFRRRDMTGPEIQRLLEHCDDEWRALVMFGLYTGQRLGDLARLTWANLDTKQMTVSLVTRKTGRTVILPIANPLRKILDILPTGDDPQQPLFPRAHAIIQRHGDSGYLSTLFNEILVSAGLALPHSKGAAESKGGDTEKPRDRRRKLNELSFHSLRHSTTTLLKNAGVSDAITRDIVGHESEAVNWSYSHISEDAKRLALNRIPDVTAKEVN